MNEQDLTSLDAKVTALFVILAQTYAIATTANAGAGNEHTLIEKSRKVARDAGAKWPPDIREKGLQAIDGFYALVERGSKTGYWG